jgi:hypothetical protein
MAADFSPLSDAIYNLGVELAQQWAIWAVMPAPIDADLLLFPDVYGQFGLPGVTQNQMGYGIFGRKEVENPGPADAWWTKQNRRRYAHFCSATAERLRLSAMEVARFAGVSAFLSESLHEVELAHRHLVHAAEHAPGNGLMQEEVRSHYVAAYRQRDRIGELAAELEANVMPTTPADDAMLTVPKLIRLPEFSHLGQEAAEKRLARFRLKNRDGWITVEDPKRNEPRFLYILGAVRPILKKRPSNVPRKNLRAG